jgi:hypothetical protein
VAPHDLTELHLPEPPKNDFIPPEIQQEADSLKTCTKAEAVVERQPDGTIHLTHGTDQLRLVLVYRQTTSGWKLVSHLSSLQQEGKPDRAAHNWIEYVDLVHGVTQEEMDAVGPLPLDDIDPLPEGTRLPVSIQAALSIIKSWAGDRTDVETKVGTESFSRRPYWILQVTTPKGTGQIKYSVKRRSGTNQARAFSVRVLDSDGAEYTGIPEHMSGSHQGKLTIKWLLDVQSK